MSDPTPSDDELISSYIDGEATLDEVARIQADPELRTRIQEFETARDLLSTPVTPLPESDVDRLIDNALWQSTTSDRITDLSAVRAMRSFNPQRLATIAATLVLLAGVVGALIALNSDSGDEIASTSADSSEMADESMSEMTETTWRPSDMADSEDDMADDGDMAESGDDMAEAMPESDMAESDESDMAEPDDSGQSVADDQTAATTTVATVDSRRSYRLLTLEIAESYETLDELIVHTTNQWRELVAPDFAGFLVPQVIEEQGNEQTEQALADDSMRTETPSRLHRTPWTDIAGSGGTLSVGETTIAGIAISITVVVLTVDHSPSTQPYSSQPANPTCAVSQPRHASAPESHSFQAHPGRTQWLGQRRPLGKVRLQTRWTRRSPRTVWPATSPVYADTTTRSGCG